jgi:hypothetical protein
MEAKHLSIRQRGRVITADAKMIGRKPANAPREGWAEAAQQIAELRDDKLVMGEFGNQADKYLAL